VKIKLKETGLLSAALFLMIMLAVPVLGAQEETLNETKCIDTTNMVSLDKAEEVASYSIKEISGSIPNLSEWENATVKLSTIYYDLDGNRTAYSFNVMGNKQRAGYIFISATKDNYPVLEFSKGKIPNEIPEFTTRSKSLAQERANKIKSESADKEELTVGEMKPLYLGPTFYYAEYTLTDTKGKAKEKVIVDLPFSTVVDFNKSNVSVLVDEKDYFNSTSLQQQQEIRKQDANAKWTALENEMAMETIPTGYSSTSSIGYIYDVPNYYWRNGCSPTAAGMVLGYWDSHGYSNFPGETTLIDELANAMGTSYKWPFGDGATWPWNIGPGIKTVCNNHGYSNFNASYVWYSIPWNEIKNEVNANRPFVICMLYGGLGSGYQPGQEYGNHCVTCIGYSEGSQNYVFLHDTWDTKNHHYITFGSWWEATAIWVRP
jgi:hypothetical protein